MQDSAAHALRCPPEPLGLIGFAAEAPDQLQGIDALPHPQAELLVLLDDGRARSMRPAGGELAPALAASMLRPTRVSGTEMISNRTRNTAKVQTQTMTR